MSNLFCLWLCREPTEIRQKVRKIYFIPTFFVFIKQTLQPVFTGLARQYNISKKLLTLTSLGGTLCPPHRLTMGHGTVLGSSTMSLFTYTWEKYGRSAIGPTLNLSILAEEVRSMMFSLNMVDYPMSFLLLSIFCNSQVEGTNLRNLHSQVLLSEPSFKNLGGGRVTKIKGQDQSKTDYFQPCPVIQTRPSALTAPSVFPGAGSVMVSHWPIRGRFSPDWPIRSLIITVLTYPRWPGLPGRQWRGQGEVWGQRVPGEGVQVRIRHVEDKHLLLRS